MHRFSQVDVFTKTLTRGNALAVVHDADGLDDDTLAAFARWTNLSETTFLLAPTREGADYRVRIFTPGGELPFAGHPTLGSARAWLEAGGRPADAGTVVQECGAGLVRVRRDGDRLAFAAPPLLRTGPVDAADLDPVVASLGLTRADVVDAQWVDNGPGWLGVLLRDADQVRALVPDFTAMRPYKVGVIGPGGDADYEVRAFVPSLGVPEDPVTGSLNAGLAQWLIGAGRAPSSYVAAQGTVIQRAGRVHVDQVGDDIWVGGSTVVAVTGTVALGG
ncbi:PhzF family phenazine biosynthesis protein [Luteipulveratus halotolerans]|uniref:Phenazine biosynthesis protein PhzF n=1 Tax=Luteipulveratus halotolerans TaxID=1631356 RepID=A0A0L6CJC9_9MICO|nr:PhzF family phenazine biosynthesis protein [Luteipulveratus halotolerans]KNX37613.1 phenazine biosynthesis protein PhzF [Luteipulveratus halotolerans]